MKTFRQALQGEPFTLTAELSEDGFSDPAGQSPSQTVELAEALSGLVDGIVVDQNRHQSATALANLLIRNGTDPVVKLNCRDRNRIALQSDLLGLRALGVTSLVLDKQGDLLDDSEASAKPVFDVSARELTAMAQAINEEEWSDGHHEFLIGSSATVQNLVSDRDKDPLLMRSTEGSRFLQTRLCLDVDLLRTFMQKLVEMKLIWNYSVVVTLAPLPSAEVARWLVENRLGAVIPESIIHKMDRASDATGEGVELCAKLLNEVAGIPGVSGANLLTLGDPGPVKEVIEISGLKAALSHG